MNLCSLRIQSQALTLIEWPVLQGTVQTKNDNLNYNGGLGLKAMPRLHIDPQNYAGQDGQYGEGPCPKGRKRERCSCSERTWSWRQRWGKPWEERWLWQQQLWRQQRQQQHEQRGQEKVGCYLLEVQPAWGL